MAKSDIGFFIRVIRAIRGRFFELRAEVVRSRLAIALTLARNSVRKGL